MIPTRLELKQFLCYREPVAIDFTGLRLACLCGDNGAGKSALLDAMTWALWERARADTSDLESLGELDTRVVFSFFLDDTEYRVIRGYTATGRTRSLLELHVRRDREWYPLASGGKQAVQREIDRLLGISYTTFTNSVFLVQGKADEFTRQSPAKRKEILAELLELERYERYRELARQEGKRLREEGLRREQEL
ncbi:MAG: AAA family ATPase, partial [Thermomicrobium sp.]|nr:AAA family ATPase [Thermomicrobium sp.]